MPDSCPNYKSDTCTIKFTNYVTIRLAYVNTNSKTIWLTYHIPDDLTDTVTDTSTYGVTNNVTNY